MAASTIDFIDSSIDTVTQDYGYPELKKEQQSISHQFLNGADQQQMA